MTALKDNYNSITVTDTINGKRIRENYIGITREQAIHKFKNKHNMKTKTGLKKDGTLKKGYKYIAGGKVVKAGLNAAQSPGLRKLAAKTVGVIGLRKKDGTLKKGFKYAKGGKVVAIKAKK